MRCLIDLLTYVSTPKTTSDIIMAVTLGVMLVASLCYLVISAVLARMSRYVRPTQQRLSEYEELSQPTIEMSARESEGT